MPDTTSSGSKALKRYGPLAVLAILVVGAIIVFGGGDDDSSDDGGSTDETPTADRPEGAPMTFQEAEEEGVDDIEWGDECDTDRGRLKVPLSNAAPCLEPWEGDNGGATSPGVTADSIKIVYYQGEPDPLQHPLGELA